MERCEDFEVSIETRLHGALNAPQTASLASHLATCASCRAFEALAKGSENAMNQQNDFLRSGVAGVAPGTCRLACIMHANDSAR